MINQNCTILTPERATKIAIELHIPSPNSEGTIQDVRRANDILNRGLVSFDHESPDRRWYQVRSQGLWQGGTTDQTYWVGINGNHRPVCTCPEYRRRELAIPDDPTHIQDPDPCKHGTAVMMEEAREEAYIAELDARERDRFACDGSEVF